MCMGHVHESCPTYECPTYECPTYEWVMRICYIREFANSHRETYAWVTCHTWKSHVPHMNVLHMSVTHMNESCGTAIYVILQIEIEKSVHESRATYERVMCQIWMSRVPHMNQSQTFGMCVHLSRLWRNICMSHVPHIHKSCPTHKRVIRICYVFESESANCM